MKKITSALALAALLGVPAAQAEVEFGGDFEFNAFSNDVVPASGLAYEPVTAAFAAGSAFAGNADDYRGYRNRIRVKAHFKNDDGVQVHTRMNVADYNWMGDGGTAANQGTFATEAADDVTLDYGFVQFPLAGWTWRIGRQEANWNFNFLSSDDRRDRILAMKKFGSTTIIGLTDKRTEGSLTNDDLDGNTWGLAGVGVANGWLWGVLLAYFEGDFDATSNPGGYGLTDTKAISPFVKGKVGPVELTGGFNYLWGGEDGTAFDDDGTSAFLRAGYDLGVVKLEGQYILVRDGGLIGLGFDTFSSMINNSPDNSQTPTAVFGIGRALGGAFVGNNTAGEGAYDEDLLALRVTGNVGDKLKLIGAIGRYNAEISNFGGVADADLDESVNFVDFQAHYQLTPSTLVWATAGQLGTEDVIDAVSPGNGDDIRAVSLNLKTNF